MAFSVLTVGTSPGAASGSCVIVKPTGTALGDILVTHINFYGAGTGVTAPSGWTQVAIPVLGGGIMYVGWKIATSTEVSATNFTFTATGGTPTANLGKMTRLTGGRESNVAYVSANATSGGGTGTAITVGTITPSVANSLLMFFTGGGDQQTSYSAHAIVTSNPSWTIVYNESYNGTTDTGLAMAYAVRPETSATGNATATQNFNVFWAGIILAIEPQISTTVGDTTTVTDTILMGLSTVKSETITLTDTASAVDTVVITNQDKSNTTWTNTDKP